MEQRSFKKAAAEFLRHFTMTLKNISLYTEYHPLGKSSLDKCYELMASILADRAEFTISTVEDRMLADEAVIDEDKLLMSSMSKELSARSILSITFQRGISRKDLKGLIDLFLLRPEQLKERGGLSKAIEKSGLSFIQGNVVKYGRISESQELLDIALAEHIIAGIKPLMLNEQHGQETNLPGDAASPAALFGSTPYDTEKGIPLDEIMNDPLKISFLFARTLESFSLDHSGGTAAGNDILMALEKLGTQLQSQSGGDWNKLKLIFARLIMSLKPDIQNLLVEKSASSSTKTSILKRILTYMPEEKLGDLVASQYLAGLKDPKNIADFILKILPSDDRQENAISKIKEKLASIGLASEEIEKILEEVHWLQDSFKDKTAILLAGDKIWLRPFSSVMSVIEEAARQSSKSEAMLLIQKYMSGLIHSTAQIRKNVIENAIPLFVFMKGHKEFAGQRIKIQNLLFRRMKDENETMLLEALLKTLIATVISEMDTGNYAEAIPVLDKLKSSIDDTFAEDPVKREMIVSEMARLESEELFEKILKDYFSSRLGAEQNLPKLLEIFDEFSVKFLIERMSLEDNRKNRYRLSLLIKSLKEKALPYLITCFDDKKWFLVRNAVLLIGDIGDQSMIPSLREPLHHPDHRVRRETVRTLMKLGGDTACDLIASMLDDADESVAIAAIEALGNAKSTKGIFKMIRIISKSNGYDSADDLLRKIAIEHLGKLRVKEAVPELAKILMKKGFLGMAENPEIRLEAVKALSNIGGTEALKALMQVSEKDPHQNIREIAAALMSQRSHDEP